MTKFHISPDGEPRACTAAEGNCMYGEEYPHFTTEKDARLAYELSQGANQAFAVLQREKKRAEESRKRREAREIIKKQRVEAQRRRDAFAADLASLDTEALRNENRNEARVIESGQMRRKVDLATVASRDPRAEKAIELVAATYYGGDRSRVVFNLDVAGEAYVTVDRGASAEKLSALADHISKTTGRDVHYHSFLDDGPDRWDGRASYLQFTPDFTRTEFAKFEAPRRYTNFDF